MGDSLMPSDCLIVELGLIVNDPIAVARAGKRRAQRAKEVTSAAEVFQSDDLDAMRNYAKKATNHLRHENSLSKDSGRPIREDPPPSLTPNLAVVEIVSRIMTLLEDGLLLTKEGERKAEDAAVSTITSLGIRGTRGSKPISPTMHKAYPSVLLAAKIDVLLQELNLQYSRAKAFHNRTLVEYRKGNKDPPWQPKIDKPSIKYNTSISVIGPLVMFNLSLNRWVLTSHHYFRVHHMLKGISNMLIALPTMALRQSPIDTVIELLDAILDVSADDIEAAGEQLKAARQLLIAGLATDNLMGDDPAELLLSAYDRPKATAARLYRGVLRRLTKTNEDAINLANFFKVLPHPDTNLYKCFQTIQGLTEPNRLRPGVIGRFKGVLRRSLFASLTGMKKQVRLAPTAPEGDALAAASNRTQVSVTSMQNASHTQWNAVRFQRVIDIPTAESIVVPPSDKSSQMQYNGDFTEIESVTEWASDQIKPEPEVKKELGTINDAVSSLKGECKLGTEIAIERFRQTIGMHEEFEATYIANGVEIDDIPSEDIAKFIKRNEAARYMVGTEPKFGEKQKKVTRMFYIPEQELKSITQRIERLAKYVSRKQFGVSIVKSYSARQKDVENFTTSMTGLNGDEHNVFVSFDMSEFSKKFPMALVRAYGEVLAEITGEDWLRRIDLVFRACVVLHNSRGFFDHIEGVKGGFEGFLNFVWSSIHAVIMEIALESNGLVGNLLCFSDDGLLSFHVPAGRDINFIREKVLGIQSVYKDYGLIFHLGKTIVSTLVWEYLGDVCHNSKLLPMWVKEVASFNNLPRTKGLDPFYSKIRSIEGQARALTKAGVGYDLAYLMLRLSCHFRLQYMSVTMKPQVEELILMTPTSAGGLRIVSPAELAISCTVSTDAEVIADYESFLRVDPSYGAPLRAYLLGGAKTPKQPVRAIISGTRLRVKAPDMSGVGVVNDAIEMIKENSVSHKNLAMDPLRGEVADALDQLLRNAINIEIQPIVDLLFSMPDWVSYTKSLALAKSSSALRLVPRNKLRSLQGKDTRNIQYGLKLFQEAMAVTAFSNVVPYDLVTQVGAKVFPNYHLADIKRSPRSTLIVTEENPTIVVTVDSPGWNSIAAADYVEPHVQFPQDVTSLSWYSEATGDLNVKSARRMLNSFARFLTYSPDAQEFVIQLSILAGIQVPEMAPGILYGAHRHRLRTGSTPDFRLMLPKPYLRFARSRLVGEAARLIFGADRADRTTLVEYAKVLSYPLWARDVRLGGHEAASVKQYEFIYLSPNPIADIITNVITIRPGFRLIRDVVPLPADLHNEYHNAVIENREYARYSEAIEAASISMVELDDHEKDIVFHMSVISMKRWLIKMSSSPVLGLCPLFAAPIPATLRPLVILKAAIGAVWTLISPRARREIMDLVNRVYLTTVGRQVLLTDQPVVRAIESEAFMTLTDSLARITDSLVAAANDYLPASALVAALQQPASLIAHIEEIIGVQSFLPQGRIIAIRSPSSLPGSFTESHRVAFKLAATTTISSLLTRFANERWDEARVRAQIGININVDDLLDMLYITRLLFRASEHRGVHHPYNNTSAYILAYKFYKAILNARMNLPNGSSDAVIRQALERFVLGAREQNRLILDITGGRRQLGPDHMAQIGEPIPDELVSRATFHVRTELTRHGRFHGTILPRGEFGLYGRMTALYHHFYQSVIVGAVARMIEIPGQLEQAMIDRFAPSTPSEAGMMMIHSDVAHIQARFINVNELEDEALGDLIFLLRELGRDFLQRTFSPGFRLVGRQSRVTEAALLDMHHREGTTASDFGNGQVAEAQVVVLRFATVKQALSAYINLQSADGCSLCVFRDRLTQHYVVIGFTCAHPDIIVEARDPDVRTELMANLADLVPEVTVLGQARLVAASREVALRAEQSLMPFAISSQVVTTYIRNVVGGAYINRHSVYLQVASNLARPTSTPRDRLIAYALLLMHLRGLHGINILGALVRRLVRDINNGTEQDIMALTNDIGLSLSWLWCWRITEGPTLDPREVETLVNELPRVHLVRRLPEMATRALPVHPDQVIDEANNRGVEIVQGNLAQVLFQNPRIIPQIAFEDQDEEIRQLEEEDDDVLARAGL